MQNRKWLKYWKNIILLYKYKDISIWIFLVSSYNCLGGKSYSFYNKIVNKKVPVIIDKKYEHEYYITNEYEKPLRKRSNSYTISQRAAVGGNAVWDV